MPNRTKTKPQATTSIFTSRAVTRIIQQGNTGTCPICTQLVQFRAKAKLMQVIANVYNNGVWQCTLHYHVDCYENAGRPYGPAS